MPWTVASDISDRIKNLRVLLGGGDRPVLQEELARRAGVRTSQVSQWERGAQRPSRSRLERWAEREGWPVEIFQEGAPLPSEVLPSPGAPGTPLPAQAGMPGDVATEANQILARFYEVMADASRQGRPCPPELAVLIQQMHALTMGAQGISTAPAPKEQQRASEGEEEKEPVPGW